jgi:hypothetical protein
MFTLATIAITAAAFGRAAYGYYTARCDDGTLTGTISETHEYTMGKPHVVTTTTQTTRYSGIHEIREYITKTDVIQTVVDTHTIYASPVLEFNGKPLDISELVGVENGDPTDGDPRQTSVIYVHGQPAYVGRRDAINARFWRNTWLWPPLWIWSTACAVCWLIGGVPGLTIGVVGTLIWLTVYQVNKQIIRC